MKYLFVLVFTAFTIPSMAQAFDISFDWKGLKSCTSGKPNIVHNPRFVLRDVPAGTKFIRFKMTDLDVPNYNHGGGVVAYGGQTAIEAGAFQYKSPCPPNGTHTYRWTATAQKNRNGGKLGTAQAARKYP